jgi:chromosome segregation ATPase
MLYETIVQEIPVELQVPMIRIVEAMEQHMREELAVRREDIVHIEVSVAGLAEAQHHSEQRLGRVETALAELAQAQARTEQRVGGVESALAELAQAQARTEQRVGGVESALAELAQAQARTEQRVEELARAQARTEQRVEELAQAQARTEQRVEELAQAQARTEQRVEELAQAQAHIEQRLGRVEIALAELAQAQARTEKRVEELAQAQARTEKRLEELAQAQAHTEKRLDDLIRVVDGIEKRLHKVEIRLDRLVGDNLEERYRKNAYAFLGRNLRNIKVITAQELESRLEEHLTDAEVADAALLDVLVQGKIRHHPTTSEVLLAIEVSAVVDRADVERALRRAALLRKAGLLAIPTVAGEEITAGAEESARTSSVFVLQNGRQVNWEQAVASIVGEA